jgi:hypothetical protein
LEILECPRFEHHVLYTSIIDFIEHRCASFGAPGIYIEEDTPYFAKVRRISLFVSKECKRAVLLDPTVRRLVMYGLDIVWINQPQFDYGVDLLDEFML